MLEIFQVTTPFFALILCGFVAAHFRLLPLNTAPVALFTIGVALAR